MTIEYMGIDKYGGVTEDNNGIQTTSVDHLFYVNEAESAVDIMADSNVPKKNSQHPSGKGFFAISRVCSDMQEGDGKKAGKYIVTVSYTNNLGNNSNQEGASCDAVEMPPWKLPPYDISIGPIEVTKLMNKAYQSGDAKGSPSKPVINSAGDPIDAQTTEQHTSYSFSYNVRNFNDNMIENYIDTVNKYGVRLLDNYIPAGKGLIKSLSGAFQRVYDEDGNIKYKYWKISIEIEKAPKDWKVELMNVGFWVKVDNKRYRIYSGDGQFGTKAGLISAGVDEDDIVAVDTPEKLNTAGSAVITDDTATYIEFFDKYYMSWAKLSLPRTIDGQGATSLNKIQGLRV